MGTWGSKTFENDTAIDELGQAVDGLQGRLSEDMDNLDDGILERPALALVAMLRALAATIQAAKEMIDHAQVVSWSDRYLTWMDENKQEFGATEEFFARYRANAAEEFASLRRALE
ncbi:MAG TPA: DUF4259 domain-containing protein [Acidimicrobiales bacterium]|nr:DUF4259 domain-containing protein [Acidimicrobiales bacterium]